MKRVLFVLFIIFIFLSSGCIQKKETDELPKKTIEQTTKQITNTTIEPGQTYNKSTDERSVDETPLETPNSQWLGNLCSDEAECNSFCHDNKGLCKDYCAGNPENELCQKFGFAKITGCEDSEVKFDYAPVNLNRTTLLLPLGIMTGGHVIPTDHHYFQNFSNEEFNIEIYSPGAGDITSIEHMPGATEGEDYRIIIEHTCSISSIYIHVGILSEKLKKYAPQNSRYAGVKIPVEAGELIGYYKTNVDYSISDTNVVLPGLLVPEHYEPESWKIHTANIYDYFNEQIKSRLIEKSIRTAEPITGKIDFDIDGKLVGNWFLKDSELNEETPEEYTYWQGHLSISYDYLDPNRIVFSIGGYNGKDSEQFGVKGNYKDPSEIGIEDGLVKYELVYYDYITPEGEPWDRKSLVKDLKTESSERVQGTVLVQMIEKRKIKFEVFDGKTASQVSGFTSNAKIYER